MRLLGLFLFFRLGLFLGFLLFRRRFLLCRLFLAYLYPHLIQLAVDLFLALLDFVIRLFLLRGYAWQPPALLIHQLAVFGQFLVYVLPLLPDCGLFRLKLVYDVWYDLNFLCGFIRRCFCGFLRFLLFGYGFLPCGFKFSGYGLLLALQFGLFHLGLDFGSGLLVGGGLAQLVEVCLAVFLAGLFL